MALCRQVPDARSQSSTVSRWLVMPMAAGGGGPAASRRTRTVGRPGSFRAGGRLAQPLDAGLPDLFRVVLHPACRRVDLAKLALGRPERPARNIEQDRAGRRGARRTIKATFTG